MFSCCLRTIRGSDLNKDKSEGCGGAWRYLLLSCLQCFWPFAQKETDLTQGGQAQDHADKGERECAPKDMKEPCREPCIRAGMVGKMVNHLVPSLQERDPCFVTVFLYSFRRFATTGHVLDLLFRRYAYFHPDCKEDEQVKSTLCAFLSSWIHIYPEEFCQTSDLSILTKLQTYLTVNMPFSDLNLLVHMLLMELKQESSESEREDEEDSDLESHTSGDSETEVLFPSVKQQPELAGARDTEPKIQQNALMLESEVRPAVQPAHLLAAVEPGTNHVSRHSGLSQVLPSVQWVNLPRE